MNVFKGDAMSFCESCGAAKASGAFCPSCGSRYGQQGTGGASPTPPSPVSHPLATAKKSSSAGKVFLVVAGFCACALAAVLYAGYWAKNKVEATAAANGFTLPSKADEHSHRVATGSSKPLGDPCSFATKEDVSSATGLQMNTTEVQDSECIYVGSNGMDRVVIEVTRGHGSVLMMAARGGGKLMEMAPGTEVQADSGVGDEAVFQNGMLTARKGEDGLHIILPATLLMANFETHIDMPANIAAMRDKAKALAVIVLPRI